MEVIAIEVVLDKSEVLARALVTSFPLRTTQLLPSPEMNLLLFSHGRENLLRNTGSAP